MIKATAISTRSRLATLEAEEERARQELMHLTSSIMFKRGFDQWVSETLGAGAARRDHLEAFLAGHLTQLWADCYLTDEQKNNLQNAGREDISRFLERLEQFEKRFEGRLAFETDFPIREAESLKSSYWRAFGDDSAFAAALAATLSKEQLEWHEQGGATRNLVRYQSAIHEAAAALAKAVRMNPEQARTLEDLLRKETRPPRKFGQFSQTESRGSGRLRYRTCALPGGVNPRGQAQGRFRRRSQREADPATGLAAERLCGGGTETPRLRLGRWTGRSPAAPAVIKTKTGNQ